MDNLTSLNKQLNNYKMVDVIKYIAAIMVICIHCSQIFPQEYVDYFIKNIVCRIAVPFFFISSAYFIRKGSYDKENYVKGYLKTLTKSYLLWSLVFIPIGLDWIYQNLNIAGNLLPIAFILGLIHVGTYYHLWYIPAMIFSVFIVDKLLKRISYKTLFCISILLYLFGSLETYYGFISLGMFKDFFDTLITVIFTTRSGLFYGMIFVVIGFYIFDNQDKLKSMLRHIPTLTIISGVLLIAEGIFLYSVQKLDMNFLIMLVPFSFFFVWILSLKYIPQYDTKKIR